MTRDKLFKIIFHKDTILLLFSIAWLWLTVTIAIPQFTNIKELKTKTGEITASDVVITRIKNKPLYKDTTLEMRLYIDNEPEYYFITTNDDLNYYNSLYIGDSVCIYTRDKVWGIFGHSNHLIQHLERIDDKRVFVDYSKRQLSSSGIWVLSAVATLVFFLWYIKKVRKRLYWD